MRIYLSLFWLVLLIAASVPVGGQTKVNVRFRPGTTMGSYNGSIRGERYMDYAIRASAGQKLDVQLTVRSGARAYFNVLKPNSEIALTDAAREATSWSGSLPEGAVYVIRVFMSKSDRLAQRSANFKVRFEVETD